ncbi:ubiquinol-cytochrome C chaperone-domain-containing protein [Daldinia vernicosa]|uniref:ubiquinol-cytochrome C chaperone-domain-containing protein n=1 Tax=Daldinia vernicosa TaxID=114800 RepID=UPI002007F228|nr:ubiquinol-cytochrome C chaperone-domain-containing protein [Daldinia vernicosa]KAI0851756.1 ubiquinol-cytochrome C chaperone-domain-containing protein [Daldinia vernicosa]
MACRTCRRQLMLLTRQAGSVAEIQNAATAQRLIAPVIGSRPNQRRGFKNTPNQPAINIRETFAKIFQSTAEPYRIIHATENIYKACAREADYTIPDKDRKAGTIPKTAEGEDIGEGKTMWHEDFKLAPTFSTWSQITMLHLYLVFARLRDLEPDAARSWQRQLTDHFFFNAEERMDLTHGITSRGLRHRYLKDLFVQWRGVIAAYDEGVVKGDAVLAAAVWRNVFKAREDVDVRSLAAIVSWMRLCLKMLDQIPDEALHYQTEAVFKWRAKNELLLVDKPSRELEGQLAQETPPVQKVAV